MDDDDTDGGISMFGVANLYGSSVDRTDDDARTDLMDEYLRLRDVLFGGLVVGNA